jgi:hypothetical protein
MGPILAANFSFKEGINKTSFESKNFPCSGLKKYNIAEQPMSIEIGGLFFAKNVPENI